MSTKQIHEEFEVVTLNNDTPGRKQQLRQDRIESDGDDFVVSIGGTEYEVVNYSAFGIALFTPDLKGAPFGDTKPFSAQIFLNGKPLGSIELKWARSETGKLAAFEVVGGTLPIETIQAEMVASQLVGEIERSLSRTSEVPERFRALVFEMRDLLARLGQRLSELQEKTRFHSLAEESAFEASIVGRVAALLDRMAPPVYHQLADALQNQPEAVIRRAFEFYREQLKPFMHLAPFSDRSNTKPLGYAGDFEMMNIIYRNENVGSSLFAKCLQRYYVDHPEAKAVRNRSSYLLARIREFVHAHRGRKGAAPLKILSVASGPAFEVQRLLRDSKDSELTGVEFTFLDQDLHSLKHAQRKLREVSLLFAGTPPVLHFTNQAIKDVIKSGLPSKFDLIYSAGLFDYFMDPVAQAGASRLYQALNPGGELIIGNFNVGAPSQFQMAIALDWRLHYRSHADLTRLFGSIGKTFEIESEEENVNLFCRIKS